MWLGLPSNPQWARDLDGQQAPRSRLPANSNRLLTGPRQGGLSEQSPTLYLCYTQRSVWVVPDRMPPSLRKCPWSPPASTSQWMFPPQKYNADYDLSARQGADTLAFMSLLEEKLLPVLVSVPRPPSMGGQWARGSGIHTDTPPPHPHRLGAAWGPEAHPVSGRCTGSDLLLPSYTPNPDTYFLGRRQELCGSNPEVVRRGYALSPQLLPAWPHAAAVRGAAAAAVWGAQTRGGGRAGEGGTSGTGGCCMRGAPRAVARSGSAWQGRRHCSRSRKLTWCPPIAVPGSSGMPDPSLSAPGLSEILLWRCVSLTPGES